jgi:uncharacterized tellurite resistance protein B-like protein
MINRIKALLAGSGPGEPDRHPEEELRLAAAALLVEAARMDGKFDADERATVARLLRERFELNDIEATTLVAEAEEAVEETGQLYAFTRVVKDRYSDAERIGMIEMLWEVALADGQVDHFESNLLRRVGGLIFVSDRARGAARKRVMARLGMTGPAV